LGAALTVFGVPILFWQILLTVLFSSWSSLFSVYPRLRRSVLNSFKADFGLWQISRGMAWVENNFGVTHRRIRLPAGATSGYLKPAGKTTCGSSCKLLCEMRSLFVTPENAVQPTTRWGQNGPPRKKSMFHTSPAVELVVAFQDHIAFVEVGCQIKYCLAGFGN
jgi:hypothetical protein